MSDTMPAMPGILRIRDRIQSLDSSSRPDAGDSFFQGFQPLEDSSQTRPRDSRDS